MGSCTQRRREGVVMYEIKAAVDRLKATEVVAGYSGTKVGDLNKYVRALNPKVKPIGNSGMGGGGRAGEAACLVSAEDALDLVNALIKDGWTGRRTSKRAGPPGREATKYEYMIYRPKDDLPGLPYITVSKPASDGKCRIRLSQETAAAIRSRRNSKFMFNPVKRYK
ncbi:hypothetical protein [Ralstonia phage phiRSL1]|uniref:Uncharacterized protein n=1 Tax=Ralstonia phage phiRSL1 TaxID=1980924 RepID=B2ZXZ1_9CAUD|nr:hypothetical protein RSL1_ORF133 [Ralstonia phage phiRSL1]BAG41578.1 hypothetical protein [Ralstonia phage phiRSL1]